MVRLEFTTPCRTCSKRSDSSSLFLARLRLRPTSHDSGTIPAADEHGSNAEEKAGALGNPRFVRVNPRPLEPYDQTRWKTKFDSIAKIFTAQGFPVWPYYPLSCARSTGPFPSWLCLPKTQSGVGSRGKPRRARTGIPVGEAKGLGW